MFVKGKKDSGSRGGKGVLLASKPIFMSGTFTQLCWDIICYYILFFWGGGNISWESCNIAVMAGPGALVFSKIKINEKSVFSEPKRVIQNPAPQHGRCDLSDPCTWAFFFFVTFRFDFFGG